MVGVGSLDGQIFSHSLMALKGTDLRLVYALLMKTSIGNLLSSKTKDLFSKDEQDHFMKHLEEEVKNLEQIEDEVLQVNLFLEITKLLKIRGTKYLLEQEIEEQCAIIVHEVYEQYKRQDKQFRLFVEEKGNLSKLQQMIQFQMSKLFNELDSIFQSFSVEDQTKFAAQINEYIYNLSEEKQTQIKEKLGIDDLTDEILRKAIATSGTSSVFASIVEVSGFAFYTTATSLVVRFAELFGLTLPIGVYTGLTSTVAVLANPLFLIPILLGGGVVLVNYQNKSLKKKLLPITLVQTTLTFMSKGSNAVTFEPFITEWKRRYDEYHQICDEIEKIEYELQVTSTQIEEYEIQINEYKTKIASKEAEIRTEKQRIKSDLKFADLDVLEVSAAFTRHKKKYQYVARKVKELKIAKDHLSTDSGFFKKIGSKLKDLSTSLDIKEEEKRLEKLLDTMVMDVIVSTSAYQANAREKILTLEKDVKQLKDAKSKAMDQKQDQKQILNSLKVNLRSNTQQMKQLEKEHYGLADLR